MIDRASPIRAGVFALRPEMPDLFVTLASRLGDWDYVD